MPRVTVYVSDELKSRMDAAGAALNWSAIAQSAFGEAVAAHHLRKDPTNMDELVARLRTSKQRVIERDRTRGHENGKDWAVTRAEYDELERINSYEGDYNLDVLRGLIGLNQRDWKSFLKNYGSVDGVRPSDHWAQGFIKGAAEVFRSVVNRL